VWIKWTSSKTWIDGQYYRDRVLAEFILDDARLKIGSEYSFNMIKQGGTWLMPPRVY
jgi:hypothetical protein